MPLNARDPGGTDSSASASAYPISRTFGIVVLLALAVLVALRQVFGSIRVEVGAR